MIIEVEWGLVYIFIFVPIKILQQLLLVFVKKFYSKVFTLGARHFWQFQNEYYESLSISCILSNMFIILYFKSDLLG